MSKAAEEVYQAIATNGDQMSVVPDMQTREQLYEVLAIMTMNKNWISCLINH